MIRMPCQNDTQRSEFRGESEDNFFFKCQAFSFPYQALAFESSKPKPLLAGGNGDRCTLYCVALDLYTHLVTTCVRAMTGQ